MIARRSWLVFATLRKCLPTVSVGLSAGAIQTHADDGTEVDGPKAGARASVAGRALVCVQQVVGSDFDVVESVACLQQQLLKNWE